MSDRMLKVFAIAVGFQLVVLTGMVVFSHLPLLIGKEIHVKTAPVDPRSMFRGNYARLGYDFSRVDTNEFTNSDKIRNEEIVYISLKHDRKGIYSFASASLATPEDGVFLRGRIESRNSGVASDYFQVKYGIEAFFAPKEKALELEQDLREGAITVLMVSSKGRARIKEIVGIDL